MPSRSRMRPATSSATRRRWSAFASSPCRPPGVTSGSVPFPRATCKRRDATRAGASSTATTRAGARSATAPSTTRMMALRHTRCRGIRAGGSRPTCGAAGPAAREGARDRRPAARNHVHSRRQRGVCAHQQVVRPDHAQGSPCAGRGDEAAFPFSRQERRRARDLRRGPPPWRASSAAARTCRGRSCSSTSTTTAAPRTIDSADVNDYIREAAGDDFTAKDFRTWAGTVLAATALAKLGRVRGAGPRGRAARPTNRDVARAISDVAARLGNTAAVCRKCYVHPAIISSYLEGALPSAVAARADVRPPRPATGLRPDEAAVLRLLERHEAEDRRGTTLARQLRGSLRLVRGGKGRRTRPRQSRGAAPRSGRPARARAAQ